MARRKKGRAVNGVLLLNKPRGITSNAALQKAKYLFYAAKAGHTGSLDPLATGVLPICFGEATKFTQYLLDSDKRYLSTFTFGITTNTSDSDGKVTQEVDASDLSLEQVEQAMAAFRGDILQVPSMFSALKKNGQPLYKLAREGIEVEREARPVSIYEYTLLAFRPGEKAEADVEIHCSKGTYVRTLAEDLGQALSVGAHVSALHRHGVAGFSDEGAISLAEIETLRDTCSAEDLDHLLKPADIAVEHLMAVELEENVAWHLRRGQAVVAPQVFREANEGDLVRLFDDKSQFIGIGEVLEDGMLAPRRLVAEQQ